MGAIDLPAPFFSAVDDLMSHLLPPIARLLVWAALGAFLSMELYRLLSPQSRIANLRISFRDAQKQVSEYDGEFSEAWPLIRRMLSLAFRRIAIMLPAALAVSLPILALIVWLDGRYGHTFPPEGQPAIVDVSEPFQGLWRDDVEGAPHALVVDSGGRLVVDATVEAPIPVLHKRRWWNVLIGNPAGYLDDDAPVEEIGIDLPRFQVMPAGPTWLRGWEAGFFLAFILFGLTIKWARRIE